jgi:uncharacterized tellurite resistance protein B-like protein
MENRAYHCRRFGGTSGAAAKVAGVVALMLSRNSMEPREVRAVLTDPCRTQRVTSEPSSQSNDPVKEGGVFLNAAAAVIENIRCTLPATSILRWLAGLQETPTPPGPGPVPETQTDRQMAAALERMEEGKARSIAAYAYVLSRVAGVDTDISAAETATMERLVPERSGFGKADAAVLVQAVSTSPRLSGSQNVIATREFARLTSREEKLALIDALFAVSAADRTIAHDEDAEIGKIARELDLNSADFAGIRGRHRELLEVPGPSR